MEAYEDNTQGTSSDDILVIAEEDESNDIVQNDDDIPNIAPEDVHVMENVRIKIGMKSVFTKLFFSIKIH